MLAQKYGTQHKPVAYYGICLDGVERGLHRCERALVAAAFAVDKSSSVTLGHSITLYVSHAGDALFSIRKSAITQRRLSGYEVLLTRPELTITRCVMVNPAELLTTEDEGTAHRCEEWCN